MFETTFSRTQPGQRPWLTFAISMTAHTAGLFLLIGVSVWTLGVDLPQPKTMLAFAAPPMPPPPPPPPAPATPRPVEAAKPTPVEPVVPTPVEAPRQIAPPAPPPPTTLPTAVAGGVETGVIGGLATGLPAGLGLLVPPPPPDSRPVRVGGLIKAPALITRVDPEYPDYAQRARLRGTVVLEATVSVQGRVQSVHVVSSAGLLDRPALDAVKQWQYSPLMLNGTAVPFILTVTVSFSAGELAR